MPRSNMSCIYCDEEFEEPHLFREHMKENHDKTTSGRGRLYDGAPRLVKVDCTEASCRICSQTFDDLHCMAEHLKSKHGLNIDLDSCLGVIPFALHNRQWSCVYCNLRAATLRVLSKHMTMVHFAVITCEECGKSFANARSLVLHVERHHRKVIRCRKCRELFHTIDERLTHYKANPSCWPSVCHLCNMRFMSDIPKEKHMQEVHNIFSKNLTCTECDQTFPNTRECVKHFRIAHTDDKLCCAFCPKMFVSKARLVRHTVSHTKEKPFTCMECGKGFGSQSSLNQHVWIHREVKRFKCLPCNKQFNQKITWMAHMRSIHPTSEVVRKSLLKQTERENTEKVE